MKTTDTRPVAFCRQLCPVGFFYPFTGSIFQSALLPCCMCFRLSSLLPIPAPVLSIVKHFPRRRERNRFASRNRARWGDPRSEVCDGLRMVSAISATPHFPLARREAKPFSPRMISLTFHPKCIDRPVRRSGARCQRLLGPSLSDEVLCSGPPLAHQPLVVKRDKLTQK